MYLQYCVFNVLIVILIDVKRNAGLSPPKILPIIPKRKVVQIRGAKIWLVSFSMAEREESHTKQPHRGVDVKAPGYDGTSFLTGIVLSTAEGPIWIIARIWGSDWRTYPNFWKVADKVISRYPLPKLSQGLAYHIDGGFSVFELYQPHVDFPSLSSRARAVRRI